MRAGRLTHLITIQSPAPATATSGATAPAWDEQTPFVQCYGSIQPLRGREMVSAEGIAPQATHKITTRYIAGVNTDMRIVFGERTFGIEQVRNIDESDVMLEIIAVEGTVQGK
jgi:SPP1 family predicted phage head-tail adaptor